MTNKKICVWCKIPLDRNCFSKDSKAPDGKRYVCKECLSRKQRDRVAMKKRDEFNRLISWPPPQGFKQYETR